MRQITVRDAATATAVLEWNGAAPPVLAGSGSTLALRAAMARFAGPGDHGPRRARVEEAIASVDVARLEALVRAATRAWLGAAALDAVALARHVPVVALAAALGLDPEPADEPSTPALLADVERVAGVIGRGAPVTPEADEAAERLLALAAAHPAGAVQSVSLLYQCLDATAALLLTTLHAEASGAPRVAAVPRTRRVASASGVLATIEVAVDDEFVVELGEVGLEFGAGPHSCPGRVIAEEIVTAMCGEIEVSGHAVDLQSVTVDGDGRPITMTLRRGPSAPHGGATHQGQTAARHGQRVEPLVGHGPHGGPAEERAQPEAHRGAEHGDHDRLPANHRTHLPAGHADRSQLAIAPNW